MRRIALLAAATLLCGSTAMAAVSRPAAGNPPLGFTTTVVLAHLGRGDGGIPTAFAYAPDGRIFIGRKAGVVDVYDHGVRHVFLDLSAEVNSVQGRGLLGLAVDPNYAVNGRVYVMFTQELHPHRPNSRGTAGGEIISVRGLARDPDTANPASRVTLLTGYNSSAPQHADGALRFDRAGLLYASWGDGTADAVNKTALAAQHLGDLRGKIIRIDPRTGAGVPGNPWYDAAHPRRVASKVYAFGFRNPYRFSIDPQNGTLYVGDVGWVSWEELDAFPVGYTLAKRDRNGGWPCYEGAENGSKPQAAHSVNPISRAACHALYPPSLHGTGTGADAPLYAYPHQSTACIIGGPKYTGTSNYPSAYIGKLFVADWARDLFQTVDPITGAATNFGTAGSWGQPVDIQVAPDGDVAYLALATNSLVDITYRG
jgi:glucose/arabinose dehydrogenase